MTERKDSSGDSSALNTAYAYNTRPARGAAPPAASGWHPQIDRLLADDYQFLGYRYAGAGCLYRGVSAGLDETLVARRLTGYDDGRPLCRLEAELGVYLISHDLSDALSVARLWECGDLDAAVFVFPAQMFAAAWEARRAAVLGFAEPGVVFKYPFVVEPFALEQAVLIVVPSAVRRRYEALLAETSPGGDQRPLHQALQWCRACGLWDRIVAPALDGGDSSRDAVEAAVTRLLDSRALDSACPQPTGVYPRRRSR